MIEVSEKDWRMTLAQCACSIKGSTQMSDDSAIDAAIRLMTKCGLSLTMGVASDMRNTVEPPKCPICKGYIWPHEEATGDKHKRCYDGIALRTQAGR